MREKRRFGFIFVIGSKIFLKYDALDSQEVRRISMREVGQDKIRVDAYGKVTGEAKYTADLEPKNILHGKV